jgi:hypothetical protein
MTLVRLQGQCPVALCVVDEIGIKYGKPKFAAWNVIILPVAS